MTADRPVPVAASRSLLLREWPLLLGLAAALLWLLHPGWIRFGYPAGADWDSYLASAAHLWIEPTAYHYNEWRQPAYPWLIGLLGTGLGYVAAGQLMALLGCVGVVLGAGLLGRALATPAAGGLAALVAVSLPVVVDGSIWVNPYPVVGACTALALAAAAWCLRWPHPWAAALAGLFGGGTLALDPRGLAVAIALPLLVALGPVRPSRRLGLVALVCLGLLGGWGFDRGLQRAYDLELRPLSSQLEIQHEQVRGPGAPRHDALLDGVEACTREGSQRLGPRALWSDCARERRQRNVDYLRKRSQLLSPLAAAALLLLGLLPAGWGRRSSLATALVFLPSAAALWLGISWVAYVDRYLLPVAALWACLAPVGILRAGGWLAGRWPARPRLVWLGPGLAVAWVALVPPGLHPGDLLDPLQHIVRRKGEVPAPVDPREELAVWAAESLGREDKVLDCGELHLRIRALPARPRVWDAPPHDRRCRERILRPPEVEGELWLITLHQRSREPDPRLPTPDWVEGRGWEEVPLELDLDPETHAGKRALWLRRWRWGAAP